MTHDALRRALLDSRVPRYTSFPPASRFSGLVGPAATAAWLGGVPDGAAISLYVHVPFCRRLCWFCACRTQGLRSLAPLDRFLDHLEREVAAVRSHLPGRVAVTSLHLGGGTPTLLSAARIDRLAAILRAAFPFGPETEVAVEIDPCEIDDQRLDALVRLGLNRASIGVQDFDPEVQAAIGREQGIAITARAVEGLRRRGVGSVSFDLLYGLPHQSEARLIATLREALRHRPDRIALFGYAHVPWMSRRQRLIPEGTLPGPAERLTLAATARELLLAEGYVAVGIDHFALPQDSLVAATASGRLRRNFQGYTTDMAETLVGLGPSAISRFDQGYAQNAAGTGDWQDLVTRRGLATTRGHALSGLDRLAGDLIERLMCVGRVDLALMARGHAVSLTHLRDVAEAAMAELPGVARLDNDVLAVASPAYSRLLAARFDHGLGSDGGTFSLAS